MKKIIISIIVLVLLALGWYLLSPLFLDREVDEAFPGGVETLQSMPTFEGMPAPEVFAALSEEEKQELIERMARQGDTLPNTVVTDTMPDATPTKIAEGVFVDADAFHKGSGTAAIYSLEGKHIIRLEDFSVTNGPNLHVFVSSHPAPRTAAELKSGAYLDLGALRGNKGNQNYELPEGRDPSLYKSVVIYCVPFSTMFTTASL